MLGVGINLRMMTLAMASMVLVGCNRVDNFTDLQAFIEEINSRPSAEVEPVPVFAPYEGFIYGAASMRSPFEVPVVIDSESGTVLNQDVQPDFERPRELLESQSLSEMSMVGMLTRGGVYEALIEDGFGEVHRLGIGNYMGRNYGHIVNITDNQVYLIEIVPSGSGGWVERPQTLTLQ